MDAIVHRLRMLSFHHFPSFDHSRTGCLTSLKSIISLMACKTTHNLKLNNVFPPGGNVGRSLREAQNDVVAMLFLETSLRVYILASTREMSIWLK